jgi:hypothetical protein
MHTAGECEGDGMGLRRVSGCPYSMLWCHRKCRRWRCGLQVPDKFWCKVSLTSLAVKGTHKVPAHQTGPHQPSRDPAHNGRMDMMDDGHQHLHIGCFANQQNHLLSLNLPASTSIYQHLPASTSLWGRCISSFKFHKWDALKWACRNTMEYLDS